MIGVRPDRLRAPSDPPPPAEVGEPAERSLAALLTVVRAALDATGVALLRVDGDGLVPVVGDGLHLGQLPLDEAALTAARRGSYPLVLDGRLEGVLVLEGVEPEALSLREGRFQPLLDLAAVALRITRSTEAHRTALAASERLREEAERRARLFHALHEIAVAVAGVLELIELARLVADHARDLVGSDAAIVMAWDENDAIIRPLYTNDERCRRPEPPVPSAAGAVGQAVLRREPVAVQDYPLWEHAAQLGIDLGVRSVLAVPLLVAERVEGVIGVRYYRPHRFTEDEVEVLRLLAGLVAPSLHAARNQAERQRAEATVRFQARLLEAVGQAVIATDPLGIVTYWNRAAEIIYGWTSAEAVGRPIIELTAPSTSVEQAAEIMTRLRSGQSWSGEFEVIRRDGTVFPALVTDSPVYDERGELIGIIGVSTDISDRRRAEQEALVRARQQAVVAELGQRALAADEPVVLMLAAVQALAETLDLDLAVVLELLPGGEGLLLRAGVGHERGDFGQRIVDAGPDSCVGYVLRAGAPVIVEDLYAETRFASPFLQAYGVISGAGVAIPGPDRPFGVLSVHTTRRRAFSPDDLHFLQEIANLIGTVVQRVRAAEALRASEERFRLVVSAMHEGVVVQDETGRITTCNASAEAILGLTADQMMGRTSMDPRWRAIREDGSPFPGEEHPAMVTLRTGEPQANVIMGVHKPDDTLTWISINSVPLLRPGESAPHAVVATFTDITDRRQAAQALLRREAQLAEAQHLAHLGSWEWDIAADRVTWSDELYRICGLEPGECQVTYEFFLQRLHPEEVPRVRSLVRAALTNGNTLEFQARIRRPDGSIRHIQTNGAGQHGADGQPVRMVGTVLDITDRVQTEQALRASEERFRRLADNAPDVIYRFEVGEKVGFSYVSPAVTRVLGYTPEQFYADPEFLGKIIHPDDLPLLRAASLENQPMSLLTLRCRHQDGRTLWIEQREIAVHDDAGRLVAFEGIACDVTERRESEEALRRSNQQLETALAELRQTQQQVIQQERLRALGQMASGIAHDFNNALAPVVAYSELLLLGADHLDQRTKEFVEMIQVAGQDAAAIVGRLREFYRQPEKRDAAKPLDLDALVAEAISLTQFRWKDQAQARGATILMETDLQPTPPVLGDPAALREALINLILNAIDALPGGGTIAIRTRVEGDEVVLAVRDNGIGMTDETRQRCFEPFFTTKGEHGTGLGLGMVHGIVRRHGGRIDVESRLGAGTSFLIRLPVAREPAAPSGSLTEDGPSRPLRVLLIEDDPRARGAVAEYLAVDGHHVETAEDGRRGLERFRAGRFDLVITDRAMPEVHGDQVAETIRQLAPNMPIIMLTGFGDLMRAAGERPLGVDAVLSKPITLGALRQAIGEVV